jgi:hypothetical protein
VKKYLTEAEGVEGGGGGENSAQFPIQLSFEKSRFVFNPCMSEMYSR